MSITVYFLRLNNMRGSFEEGTVIAASFNRESLVNFLESELTEPYKDASSMDDYGNDHPWHKVFKKGGPLEWYNKPFAKDYRISSYGHGIGSWVISDANEEDRLDIMQSIQNDGIQFLM